MKTKKELIDALAAGTGQSKRDIEATLNTMAGLAKASIQNTGVFNLPGIVGLKVVGRAARTGRNPATGLPVEIPAKRVVKAKPSSELTPA